MYFFLFLDMKFIVLNDITRAMKKPCVMDVKIGLQTWEPGCSEKKRKDENVTILYLLIFCFISWWLTIIFSKCVYVSFLSPSWYFKLVVKQ